MTKVIKWLTLLIVVLLLAGTTYQMMSDSPMTTLKPKWKPHPAPELKLTTMKDKEISLAEFKGKIVLLNFWASWCEPCRVEFPSLLRLVEKLEPKVVLLAISSDENNKAIDGFLKPFQKELSPLKKKGLIHVVWDKDQSLTRNEFRILKFPETFIIDSNQMIQHKVVGATEWDSPTILSFLERL